MFTLEIETGNEAFEQREEYEVAEILRKIAERLVTTEDKYGKCIDSNGNTVGKWELTND